MKLKKHIKSLTDVPERFRSWYDKDDKGEYELKDDVEIDDEDPTTAKAKVKEFRETNIRLTNELKELREQIGDVDLDQARDALKTKAKAEEEALKAKGDLDKIVESRMAAATKEWEREKAKLKTDLEAATVTATRLGGKVKAIRVKEEIEKALTRTKLVPKSAGALEDLMARAERVWSVDEKDAVIAKRGDEMLYGKKGVDPLTPDEWLTQQLEEADHLFQPGGGGGAGGGEKEKRSPSGVRIINKNDPLAMGRAAEDILAGKAIAQ